MLSLFHKLFIDECFLYDFLMELAHYYTVWTNLESTVRKKVMVNVGKEAMVNVKEKAMVNVKEKAIVNVRKKAR